MMHCFSSCGVCIFSCHQVATLGCGAHVKTAGTLLSWKSYDSLSVLYIRLWNKIVTVYLHTEGRTSTLTNVWLRRLLTSALLAGFVCWQNISWRCIQTLTWTLTASWSSWRWGQVVMLRQRKYWMTHISQYFWLGCLALTFFSWKTFLRVSVRNAQVI